MKKNLSVLSLLFSVSFLQAQNVGVGVTNPQEKLDVSGGVKVGYTSGANNGGTLRYTGSVMEYNTGFGWRSLVNSYTNVEMSGVSPLISNVRNAWVEVPNVSLTVTEPGIYLFIFKAMGYSNGAYYPSGGNFDQNGLIQFRMNGNSLTTNTRRFLAPEYTGDGNNTLVRYDSNPVEYSTVQNITGSSEFKIYAQVGAAGTVTDNWVINEASITAIRLY